MTIKNNNIEINKRSCGDCTKCCEGWLSANIKGHKMDIGKPCFFLEIGKGCTIYDTRPKDPCKDFVCEWLINEDFPENLKPSESDTIFQTKILDGVQYLRLTEAGKELPSSVLSWAFGYSLQNQKNFVWKIENEVYWIGEPRFNIIMDKERKNGYRNI